MIKNIVFSFTVVFLFVLTASANSKECSHKFYMVDAGYLIFTYKHPGGVGLVSKDKFEWLVKNSYSWGKRRGSGEKVVYFNFSAFSSDVEKYWSHNIDVNDKEAYDQVAEEVVNDRKAIEICFNGGMYFTNQPHADYTYIASFERTGEVVDMKKLRTDYELNGRTSL